jgi:hypothetical protein
MSLTVGVGTVMDAREAVIIISGVNKATPAKPQPLRRRKPKGVRQRRSLSCECSCVTAAQRMMFCAWRRSAAAFALAFGARICCARLGVRAVPLHRGGHLAHVDRLGHPEPPACDDRLRRRSAARPAPPRPAPLTTRGTNATRARPGSRRRLSHAVVRAAGRNASASADATMELKVKTVRYFKSLASLHEKLISEPGEAESAPSAESKERVQPSLVWAPRLGSGEEWCVGLFASYRASARVLERARRSPAFRWDVRCGLASFLHSVSATQNLNGHVCPSVHSLVKCLSK